MTLPADQRLAHERGLFRALFDRVGDQCIDDVWFPVGHPDFRDYLPTTWQQLVDRKNLVAQPRVDGDEVSYKLYPYGWLRGVKGLDSDAATLWQAPIPLDVLTRLVAVVTACKSVIGAHGRSTVAPQRVLATDIEATTGIGRGWIQNAINCHLLDYAFPDKTIGLSYHDGGDDADADEIGIPSTLGHPKR